jgi:hypothetical protein
MGRGLLIVRQTAAHAPWLEPWAADFVRKLIESKGRQALGYQEVWLLVIDTELIIGPDLIEAALAQATVTTPPNWKRLYLLPAANPDDVQSLTLGT